MEENYAGTKGAIRFDSWIPELPEPETKKAGKHMSGSKNPFWRDYKILIIAAAVFTIYSILLSAYVNWRAEIRVCEVVGITRSEMKDMEKAMTQEPEEEPAEEPEETASPAPTFFKTGQESYDYNLHLIEDPLAIHVASLRQNRKCTKAGAETYAWVDIAILKSGKYGDDLTDFISDPKKIEGYDANVNVRDEDTEIAHKVAEMVMNKKFPNGFTLDYQYAVINADGSVTARTDLKVKSTTRFWAVEG